MHPLSPSAGAARPAGPGGGGAGPASATARCNGTSLPNSRPRRPSGTAGSASPREARRDTRGRCGWCGHLWWRRRDAALLEHKERRGHGTHGGACRCSPATAWPRTQGETQRPGKFFYCSKNVPQVLCRTLREASPNADV
jgi:hypothetical protein